MSCNADYYLVTCSQRRLLCADVCSAQTSRRYQNRKCTAPSQFGIVGAFFMVRVGALKRIVGATRNLQHLLLFAANTILLLK
jgi:hypothetical protein